jgi:hypothetical protein
MSTNQLGGVQILDFSWLSKPTVEDAKRCGGFSWGHGGRAAVSAAISKDLGGISAAKKARLWSLEVESYNCKGGNHLCGFALH